MATTASDGPTGGPAAFGPLLRRHRVAAGLTQEALAEAAGVSARAVRALEGGERRAPHRDTVRRLAGALGLAGAERAALEAAAAHRRVRQANAAGPAPALNGASRAPAAYPAGSPGPHAVALPVPLTPFVGREREAAAIAARLQRHGVRLLTLTGPGGVGKTRLALRVATDLRPAYPDGVRLAALAALRDPALVPQAVAAAVGVREAPGRPLLAGLTDALRARRLLLVLDNCEHLLPGAAPVVAALLAACPGLTVLATSREALRLTGEHEHPVPPLRLPEPVDPGHPPELAMLARCEAVALFVERAAAVRPDFALSDQNAPAVAEVCRRLDGLPLAIELAAARVRLLPPGALLAQLDRRLEVLVRGPRDAPDRQRTLRATLDWSYDLLAPAERALFDRLGVFSGGFTLAAAEAVCAGAGIAQEAVLLLLAHLVDKSLVEVDAAAESGESVRHRLLETLRQYARERLGTVGAGEPVYRRHAAYYLALAEQAVPALRGPHQGAWFDRLEAEHDNLRQALGWFQDNGQTEQGLRLGAALWWFWYVRGYVAEAHARLTALLALPAARAGTSARARALYGAAMTTGQRGDHAGAGALFAQSLAVFRDLDDRQGIAYALRGLGSTAAHQDDFAGARTRFEESLALFRAGGDPRVIAVALASLGRLAWLQGDRAGARARLDESLALAREAGAPSSRTLPLALLGYVALDDGDYAAAGARFEECLAVAQELRSPRTAYALEGLGYLALVQGDAAAARGRFEECLAQPSQQYLLRDYVYLGLAAVALHEGDAAAAWGRIEASLLLGRERGERCTVALGLDWCAAVAAAQGRSERAVCLAGAAAALRAAIGAPLLPLHRRLLDRWLGPARQALGAEACAAWAAGLAMTSEQATAYALEDPATSRRVGGASDPAPEQRRTTAQHASMRFSSRAPP